VRRAGIIVVCAGILVGCPKKNDEAPAEGGVAALVDASVTSTVMTSEAGAEAVNASPAAASFGGKYVVSAGTMYVPAEKEWASVKFKNDDSQLLGEGDLTLASDAAGRVSGETTGGPLGAAIVEGRRNGQTLVATLRRKDPRDEGLTGTLVATIVGNKLDGSMKLAGFNAAVVRVATFSATKK
jgi:hypothetical protein